PQQIQTLQGAVADNDIKQARETAHTLKGSLANFGARAAMELAAELEAKATAGDLADANTTCKELADAVEAVLASLNDALSRHGD
ncbi:MAG: Hpt domain-containing protein, partial [Desulfobulbaceae bacterium]|nr:Hpt domain-containing protein [Desulfobulbaceae bacterium]